MKQLLLITIAVLLSSYVLNAKDKSFKYGKVEQSEVSQKEHPIEKEAHAAYIYKKASVEFEFTSGGVFLVTEHEERLKIYDEQGEDYAEYTVMLYKDGGEKQKISGIKGKTYNLENGKVVESKLKKDAIFHEETSENYVKYTWAMPDVKAGSVIEVKYRTRSPWFYTIPRFDFQADVPVDYAKYSVQIPQRMTYTAIPTGYVRLTTNKTDRRGDSGMETAYEFEASNIESLEDDDYVLDIDDYRSSLKYELYMTNFDVSRYYSKSWNEIAKDMMDSPYFGKELNKKAKGLEHVIDATASMSEDEKIQYIYAYVQDNYNWNGSYGFGKDVGRKQLLKSMTGSIGDINMLLIKLLNDAGVKTKPFATKTRDAGILNTSYPSRSELNYLLAYVPQGEKYLLLDATSKYVPVGQLPRRAINMNGIVFYDETAKIVEVTNPNRSIYQAKIDYSVDVDMPSLVGAGKSKYKEHAATQYRIDQDNTAEEEDEEESEEEDEEDEVVLENKIEYTSTDGLEDITSPISFEFEEELYNEIKVMGDQIFIDAMLDFGPDENPFYEENREMPVFYSSIPKMDNVVTIAIPEGYQLESVPESIKMSLEGRKMSFGYNVKEMSGQLNIYYSLKVKTDTFGPNEYAGLKQIYDAMIAKSKEKIVLTKI